MKRNFRVLTFVLFASLMLFSFKNQKHTANRVDDIIQKMSLQEKLEFIGGYESFNIRPFPQYGIPEIHMSDGPVGVRNYGPSTAYAASVLLAASWDRDMAKKVGAAIGEEARSKDVQIMLGPAMNIYRAPYCGRNFEYMGEDPYLAGEIASSYVIGMQKQGVVATAKHFVANNQEYDRHQVSSDMDERTLREIYLPAFKACVEKGHVGAVMTSYNLVNGIHCSQNGFIIDTILKKDWGFKGIVMSDWVSTYNGVACAKAGLDLEMPSGRHMNPDTLMAAIKAGKLSEKMIDDKVRRILDLYERFGFLDHSGKNNHYVLDTAGVRKVAIDEARDGIVLLKNENSILPLQKSKIKKIAVVGVNASPAVTGGGGSSYVEPLHPLSLLEAVKRIAGKEIQVSYAPGIAVIAKLPKDYFKANKFYTYVDGKPQTGISAEFYKNVNLKGDPILKKNFTRLDITFDDSTFPGLSKDNFSARFTGYFKVKETGKYRLVVAGDDGYRLFLNGKKVIEQWKNQPETITSYKAQIQKGVENKVVVEYYQAGGSASVRLGYNRALDQKDSQGSALEKAVNIAANSDVVIISAGFNNQTEHEGADRNFVMPYHQDKLIAAVEAVNPNCIVVLNSGGNVAMPWLDRTKGLIHAWYPGQEGNIAVAEILFGITNPSGKLPMSFAKKWEDNATANSYFDTDNDKHVKYSEGVFLGYRHFDKTGIKPLFPFGFGLSYTTFEYSDLNTNGETFKKGDTVKVSFTLKNTGTMDGAEVCELYVGDPKSELPRPVKELKGFAKVRLKKGAEKTVTIKLDASAFSYFNKERGGWYEEPGKFEILVGSSSRDIRLKKEISVTD